MSIPDPIWIYRITHIANLEYDLRNGLFTANSSYVNPNYKQIGDSSLIDYRKVIPAIDPPGGSLSDYIPFYFGSRSPMLYQIVTGWEDIMKYPQQEIIYYISSVPTIKQYELIYFFTDGHARSLTSTFYNTDADFTQLDWDAIKATYWKSDETDLRRKEKKQSEFFIKHHVPIGCIQYIGVYNKQAEQNVLILLTNNQLSIPVRISPKQLYYDHL